MNNNSRIVQIQPFHVMAILARARELEAEGRDIVHMEIGEPDFPTPAPIVEAGMQAIRTGDVHYTPAIGLPALRQAIAAYYQHSYQCTVSPEQVVVTPGASGALMLALGVVMDKDEEVLMADPGYPCNRNFVRFLSGQVRSVAVDADTGYQLSLQHVKDNWQKATRAVVIASPSNPTGTVIAHDELVAIAEFVKQQEGYLIVDEIYHGLVYEQSLHTAANLNEHVIVINSFSKYFNMTGWRAGWLITPEALQPDMDKLAQNIFLAAPTPAQYAALAAFKPETIRILESRKSEFQQRRKFLLDALRQLGFSIQVEPQGAFYIYAGCEKFADDSFSFAIDLLENIGVAITPGKDFGEHAAERHVRFAYTTSLSRLQTGIQRLQDYLG